MTFADVIRKMSHFSSDLRLKAEESGDFNTEDRYNHQADIIDQALEYLHEFGELKGDLDHYVTFTPENSSWFVEHPVACRLVGTLGTCEYNARAQRHADNPGYYLNGDEPVRLNGRYRFFEGGIERMQNG